MGTFFGWFLLVCNFLLRLGITGWSLVKYYTLPKEEKKSAYSMFAVVFVPFIINLMYFITALTMMICIPHFSWWMAICFFLLLSPLLPQNPIPLIPAYIAVWILIYFGGKDSTGDACRYIAFTTFCLGELLCWLLRKWRKKLEAAKANTVDENEASQSK